MRLQQAGWPVVLLFWGANPAYNHFVSAKKNYTHNKMVLYGIDSPFRKWEVVDSEEFQALAHLWHHHHIVELAKNL